MKFSKHLLFPNLPLPWLPPPPKTLTLAPTTKISNSKVLLTIKDPNATLKQILTVFASASRQPSFHHNYQTYQTLIPLLSHRRQFKAADVILSIMRRRDGLAPGSTVLVPLVGDLCGDGRHVAAADLFLRFSKSSKVFSFLFDTLAVDGELEVAESLITKAADLGLQIQVRYYNALIKGFCNHLRIDDGIRILKGMMQIGISPDVITFSTLMSPLGKEGRVLESNALLGKMLLTGILPDFACFKILFRLYCRNKMAREAVGALRAMASEGILGEGENLQLDGSVSEGILGAAFKRGSLGFFLG